MKKFFLIVTAVCGLSLLAGCGLLKQKAASYYLAKAHATAQKQSATEAELVEAFAQVEKSYSYAKNSPAVVATLEELAASASKSGITKGQELQSSALKTMLTADPLDWSARESMINLLASRGDLNALADQVVAISKIPAGKQPDLKQAYCAMLAQLAATASALPWLESEAYLNMNKSPDVFFEKTTIYASAAARAAELKTELEKAAAKDPALKSAPPQELVSSAEVACADALRDKEAIARVTGFSARLESDRSFASAVKMTVQGNVALAGKEYAQARAYYQGALQSDPALLDARKQLAETDFQEGASLAAVGDSAKTAEQLLGKAYAGLNIVIKSAGPSGGVIPFVKPDKFLGDAYALKAGVISAQRAMDTKKTKKTAKLEAEFKLALDEAVRLSPDGRLARELLDRYNKEGF